MSTVYGDISPRTAAFVAARMLDRAIPQMCMGRFGQQAAIPKNKTNAIKWRRYNAFAPSLAPLVEGVTPAPDVVTSTDVSATLQQYGRRIQVSDVISDTHEDPVLMEYAGVMGEVAAQTQEMVIFNVLRAGTNVLYAGSSNGLRTGVNASMAGTSGANALNRAIRQLKRQNAKYITRMLAASDRVSTAGIRPAFIAFCHPDMQMDLESIPGWKNPVEYGTYSGVLPNELGSFKEIRFLASTLYTPFLAAATVTGAQTALITNGQSGGTSGVADVYPIIIVAADAFATVSLAGSNAVTPIVVNNKPSDSDVLGQRSHVAFKMYSTAAILNDSWLLRLEAGVAQ